MPPSHSWLHSLRLAGIPVFSHRDRRVPWPPSPQFFSGCSLLFLLEEVPVVMLFCNQYLFLSQSLHLYPKHALILSKFKMFWCCYKHHCIERVELIFTAKFPLKKSSVLATDISLPPSKFPFSPAQRNTSLKITYISHFASVNVHFSILIILELQH